MLEYVYWTIKYINYFLSATLTSQIACLAPPKGDFFTQEKT